MSQLLEVKKLSVTFKTHRANISAVNEVSFSLARGEALGIVGESGSGKSTIALSILGLIPSPPGEIKGQIIFENKNLLTLSHKEMQKIRGSKISMIFQDPLTSLNPLIKIGEQIAETLIIHKKISKGIQAWGKATELLGKVRIPDPRQRIYNFPFELSGGMNQRVMIAIALSCKPSIVIADEPTTALDVSIQAQILKLINDLREMFSVGVILITHNLDVIYEICETVMVMYAGEMMEYTSKDILFNRPLHPYTKALLKCLPPPLDKKNKNKRLEPIPGEVLNLANIHKGCVFQERCKYSKPICKEKKPPIVQINEKHYVKCHLFC